MIKLDVRKDRLLMPVFFHSHAWRENIIKFVISMIVSIIIIDKLSLGHHLFHHDNFPFTSQQYK